MVVGIPSAVTRSSSSTASPYRMPGGGGAGGLSSAGNPVSGGVNQLPYVVEGTNGLQGHQGGGGEAGAPAQVFMVSGSGSNAAVIGNFRADEHKYTNDMERVRRNGNMSLACAIVCFFTGCCNYCANCCIAPWLVFFGHKASTMPKDLDQPQCCCLCVDGKPAENIKLWSTLSFFGICGWCLSLVASFAYAQGVLVYPDYHCTYHDRTLCSTCFEFNSTEQVKFGRGDNAGWRYLDDSWNTCMAGPGAAPVEQVLTARAACYHGTNITKEANGGSNENLDYSCPFYSLGTTRTDLVAVSRRDPLWFNAANEKWFQPLNFGLTCYGYENSLNNPNHALCTDLCNCLKGSTSQTEQSRSSESYAMFAIVLSIFSTLSMVFLCAVQLDTRTTLRQLESTWPLIKHSTSSSTVVGVPTDNIMRYQVPGGNEGTAGGVSQSGVATGIPVAGHQNRGGPPAYASSQPAARGSAPGMKTVEMMEIETLSSVLQALDAQPDGNLRRARGTQFLQSNVVTCAEFAEIASRIDFFVREEFILSCGVKNCISDLPNLRLTLASILDADLNSDRMQSLFARLGLDGVRDASLDPGTFGTPDYVSVVGTNAVGGVGVGVAVAVVGGGGAITAAAAAGDRESSSGAIIELSDAPFTNRADFVETSNANVEVGVLVPSTVTESVNGASAGAVISGSASSSSTTPTSAPARPTGFRESERTSPANAATFEAAD